MVKAGQRLVLPTSPTDGPSPVTAFPAYMLDETSKCPRRVCQDRCTGPIPIDLLRQIAVRGPFVWIRLVARSLNMVRRSIGAFASRYVASELLPQQVMRSHIAVKADGPLLRRLSFVRP